MSHQCRPRSVAMVIMMIWLALTIGLAGCASGTAKATTKPVATAAVTPQSTATAAPQPTATLPPGTLQVSDPVAARQLTFAFAQDNDVWVSMHGQPPQQITHLGLGTQSLGWSFLWTSDQSKLLAVAESSNLGYAWVITLANDGVQALPATLPTVDSAPRAWIGDRYIVYVFQEASHARAYNVYDTQTERPLTTTLSSILATDLEVRGTSVYVTDYRASDSPGPNVTPGVVRRWVLASNTVSTAYTVPALLVGQGLPVGSWDLSADASRIISAAMCFGPPCSVYLQDTSGTSTTIFRAQFPTGFFSISPDGTHAAGSLSGSGGQTSAIVQQALPSGPELTNALPDSCQDISPQILGWAPAPAGIMVEHVLADTQNNQIGVRICEVPVGASQPAHVVETVTAEGEIAFAPPGS